MMTKNIYAYKTRFFAVAGRTADLPQPVGLETAGGDLPHDSHHKSIH